MNSLLKKVLQSIQMHSGERRQDSSEQDFDIDSDKHTLVLPAANSEQTISSRFRLLSFEKSNRRKQPTIYLPKVMRNKKRSFTSEDRIAPPPRETSIISSKRNNSPFGKIIRRQLQSIRQTSKGAERKQSKNMLDFNSSSYFRKTSKQNYLWKRETEQVANVSKMLEETQSDQNSLSQDQDQSVSFLPNIRNPETTTECQSSILMKGFALKKIFRSNFIKLVQKKPLRSLRKYANAALFTIYMRRFHQKIKAYRKQNFQIFMKKNLLTGLQKLKEILISQSQQFFDSAAEYNRFDLRPYNKESRILVQQKIKITKQLVMLEFQCLKKAINSLSREYLVKQTLYYVCKHGSLSCQSPIYTAEELNCLSISEQGYLRGGKTLEQSALLLLVCVKLLVYNNLLQPSEIDWNIPRRSQETNILHNNAIFIGNIMYTLFVYELNELTQNVSSDYQVGNWRKLYPYPSVKTADSMAIKEGRYFQNELISGLDSRRDIQYVLGPEFVHQSKKPIKQTLQDLYKMIASYHRKIISYFLF